MIARPPNRSRHVLSVTKACSSKNTFRDDAWCTSVVIDGYFLGCSSPRLNLKTCEINLNDLCDDAASRTRLQLAACVASTPLSRKICVLYSNQAAVSGCMTEHLPRAMRRLNCSTQLTTLIAAKLDPVLVWSRSKILSIAAYVHRRSKASRRLRPV